MTPCLTPDEFVDLIDGTLPPARRAHVEGCAECRATSDEVREAWQAAVAIDVPEPSALFWPSINARVRAAIASPEGARGRGWWRWPVLVPAGLAFAALLVTLASRPVVTPEPAPSTGPAQAEARSTAPDAVPAADTADVSPIDDASLALVVDLAGDLPNGAWDALGVATLPELEVAVAVLSDDEQRALEALLKAEVSRPKS